MIPTYPGIFKKYAAQTPQDVPKGEDENMQTCHLFLCTYCFFLECLKNQLPGCTSQVWDDLFNTLL